MGAWRNRQYAADLKSASSECGFESHRPYQFVKERGDNTMTSLEKIILNIVSEEQGIKELALITKIIQTYHSNGLSFPSSDDIIKAFENMTKCGDIVGVNYILPMYRNKLKTMYFPKGTKIL